MNQKMKKKELFADDDTSSSESSSDGNDSNGSSSSSSSEGDTKFVVNKKYAKEYQNRKQKEELKQVSQHRREMGLASDEEGSSSEEDEDEDGELLTDAVNLKFLNTIKALKTKDQSIYDPSAQFFDEDDINVDQSAGNEKKQKPKKFKDVLREQVLEDMEKEDTKSKTSESEKQSGSKFSYDEQQEQLRKAFLKESHESDTSGDDEDWMVVKKTTSSKGPKSEIIEEKFKELENLRNKANEAEFADPRGEVKDGEKFLIDFMKNKKWIDTDNAAHVEDDEESVDADRADDFEAKYNFRFEQAEAETASSGATLSIQTYARGQTMNTIRRQDVTRKDKRQARKERKEAERKAKEEQLKRLKNAKHQEMRQKLSQVKKVIGSVEENAVDEDAIMKLMEGDFDPDKFEKMMQEAYGDDFYQKEDAEWKSDMDVRQSLENDEEAGDVVGQDTAEGGLYDEAYGDDDEGEGTQDFEADDNEEYVGGDDLEESKLEKKIKTKLQEELYKLDYEDIVAGMPTRFKYRQVEANDYGVTTQEILLARDTTLKQFVSLKKMAPYNEIGEHNVGSKKRRRFREMLKNDLEEEWGKDESKQEDENVESIVNEEEGQSKKKRRRLKKGKKKSKEDLDKIKSDDNNETLLEKTQTENEKNEEKQKKTRRKKKGKKSEVQNEKKEMDTISNEKPPVSEMKQDLNLNGIEPVNKKRKKKKSKSMVADLPKARLASYGL